ncbi:MAG: antibiotic biosynthesis monooxygenase family protein [Acidimicrobiales bacterium]
MEFETKGVPAMKTVMTRVRVLEGREADWEAAMAERLANAADRRGFQGAQILFPLDERAARVIQGTWESRADWEAWHDDPAFTETRARLDSFQESVGETWWYDVGTRQRPAGLTETVLTGVSRARDVLDGLVGRIRSRL